MDISLESIERQPDGKYSALDDLFTEMRNDIILDRASNKIIQRRYGGKLKKLIYRLFGMATNVRFSNVRNAFVMPLYANKRHVLANAAFRKNMDNDQFKYKVFDEAIADLRKTKGYINMNSAKIGGAFSNYIHEVGYDAVFFFLTLKVKPRTAVSILLHELGHGFHMMEFSDRSHDINTTMAEVVRTMRDTKKKPREYEYIIKDFGKSGVDDDVIEDILNSKTRQIFAYRLSKAVFDTQQTHDTHSKYSEVSNERLADNFATRCGYGADLVVGLSEWTPDVIWRNNSTNCVTLVSLWEISVALIPVWTLAGVPWFGLFSFLITSVLYVFVAFSSKNVNMTYDDGINRFRSVHEDLVQQLKTYRGQLSPEAQRNLINQYEIIDKVINSKTVYNSVKNMLANSVSFNSREISRDVDRQRQFERMSNNPMFVESIKIALEGEHSDKDR